MAAGDIKSIAINPNGWTISVTFDTMSTGGIHSLGTWSGIYQAVAPKITLTIAGSSGYTQDVLGTKSRSTVAVPTYWPTDLEALRKAYPDQANPDEYASGSDLVVVYALSEQIYTEETNITADILAGLCVSGGITSNSATGISVSNNSGLAFSTARVVGNWIIAQKETNRSSTIHLEFLAGHKSALNGQLVEYVKFVVSDGTNSVTAAGTLGISADSSNFKIVCYQADIDVSSLTDLSMCTVRAYAYPRIGDASCILDTGDGVNTFPTPLYTNFSFRLDKTDKHGKTCVDATSGNDATGTVYATRALAEAGNAFLTIAAALTALQAYHNSNCSHNDAGGGIIYCKSGTYTIGTTNGGTLTSWVTITTATGLVKSDVNIQPSGNNVGYPTYMKLSGVTYSGTGNWYRASCSIYFHNDVLANTSTSPYFNMLYAVAHNCTGDFQSSSMYVYGTYNTCWALIRGNTFTNVHRVYGYTIIGNKNLRFDPKSSGQVSPFADNFIFSYNSSDATGSYPAFTLTTYDTFVHGALILQNRLSRYNSGVNLNVAMCNDGNTLNCNNILIFHNTFCGQYGGDAYTSRFNNFYNDLASGAGALYTNITGIGNIVLNYNCKSDPFGSNSLAINNWSVRYHVGWRGNHFAKSATEEWFGEWYGIGAVKGTGSVYNYPMLINDVSGGDYHLLSSSPCKAIVDSPACLYDADGNLRHNNGAAGIFEYSSGFLTKNYWWGNY